MAVTETTAETDGSLTAVTVAETETDCYEFFCDTRKKDGRQCYQLSSRLYQPA